MLGDSTSADELLAGLSRSLLAEDGFSHDGILSGHSAAEGAFHLGTEGELAQVVSLFGRRDEALLLQGLVLEALQPIAQVMELGQTRIPAGKVTDGALGGGNGGTSTDG